MGKEDELVYNIEDITFDLEEWDKDKMNDWPYDMHGYPVYDSVVKVQDDLQEEQLRNTHPDLKKAYDAYQVLLEKYKFWEKFDNKG